VTDWAVVFLGVMAVALVVMAGVQIGLIIVAVRAAKQVSVAVEDLRREIKPLSEKVNRIADDAARAASLAVFQAERFDRFLASTVERVDTTLGLVQSFASGPVRQGAAVVAAFRAVTAIIREWRGRSRSSSHRDDDEALFVG
jgi:uncharacterized caspase-like protein